MKKFKLLLLIFGFAVLALLIRSIGLDRIYSYIIDIKWNWFIILTPFLFVYIFDTLGWKYSFKQLPKELNYSNLLFARMAGEAINYITPTAYMGGEPIKANILKKKGVSTVDAIASVVIAKTTMTIAQIIFAIMGLIIAFINYSLPLSIKVGTILLISTFIVLVAFVVIKQQDGLFIPLLNLLKRFKINFLEKKREKVAILDQNISIFYNSHKYYFMISTGLHLIGWIIGVFEVYFIVKAVGVEITFAAAFVVESLFVVIKAMFFIIPGSLGAQEGGTILIFKTLGFGGTIGLTVGIVKRIRELLWIAIGLSILAKYELMSDETS